MKKAQIGQIVVYLLAMVIFAMVLIFGYRAVVNLRQQTDQVAYLSFQKGLEADIESIYFDYESVKQKTYSIAGYTKVCFITSYPEMPTDIYMPEEPIVENSVDSGVQKNVFLVNDKIDSFYVGKIDTDPIEFFECIDVVNGKLNIRLTGQGDSALLTIP